jgi:hypothetical protein
MATRLVSGAIAMILVTAIAAAVAMSGGHSTRAASGVQSSISAPNQTATNSSRVLLSSTQYSQYAYQIYPGPLSQQAQSALAGFNVTTTVAQNGSTKISLALSGSNQYQYVSLKPGYKLYIIETAFGDDGYHFDSSLGDDGFVMVDQNGYITQ